MKMPPVILLAAGHGGSDTGAVSKNFKHNERDQAIFLVDRIADILTTNGVKSIIAPHEHDTHETIAWLRTKDYGWGDVWAVELHRDSADTITEPAASLRFGIFYGASAFSKKVAETYQREVIARGAHTSSWIRSHTASRHGRLGWISQPEALSHLIECGFMEGSNSELHLERLAVITAGGLAAAMRLPADH